MERGLVDEGAFEKCFTHHKYNFVNSMFGTDKQSENRYF